MAKIHELPNELLFQIFESPALSFFDLLSISRSCYRWRTITTNFKPSEERLFLRPSSLPPLGLEQITSARITVAAQLRRMPTTIWNGYDESAWQLALSWDKDEFALPPPHNPILAEVADTLLHPSHVFFCAPPYAGCDIHPPASTTEQPIITFCNLKELRHQTRLYEDPTILSTLRRLLYNNPLTHLYQLWRSGSTEVECPLPPLFRRNTLITQHPLTQMEVIYRCGVRYGAHDYGREAYFAHRCVREDGALLTMGDFEAIMLTVLANVWRMFDERDADIVLADETKWGTW
jgi:hypothetical protein